MIDETQVREVETVFIRKFADAAARDRDEAEAVVQITQETVGGVVDAPIVSAVTRSDPNFAIIDAAAMDAEIRARSGG